VAGLRRVQVEVAGKAVAIPWESREALLAELARTDVAASIVMAFQMSVPPLPVELTRAQKVLLIALLDGWARRDGVSTLPLGVWSLRWELAAEIQGEPARDE